MLPLIFATYALTAWDRVLDPVHSIFQSEWWYTVGFLDGTNQDGKARHLAFMVAGIRAATFYARPIPFALPTTNLQTSLLDLDAGTHVQADEATGFPAARTFDLQAKADATHFARRSDAGGSLRARFRAGGPGFTLDLSEEPLKDQAAFGDDGHVDNGSLGKPVYVSRTRQAIVAPSTITLGAETVTVTGLAWEDHQLTDVHPFRGPIRWSWFAVLLADGSEVMAYEIRDARSGELLKNYAGHVRADGVVDNLDGGFQMTETAHAPYGTVQVPTAWTIAVPPLFSAAVRHIVPLPDVLTDAGDVKGAYFEGPCAIAGDDGKLTAVWCEHYDGDLYDGVYSPRL